MTWQALKVATLPEAQRSKSEGAAIATYVAENFGASVDMITACIKQQDADPDFRAAFAKFRQ